jgi:CRISP-associated protein Cas1
MDIILNTFGTSLNRDNEAFVINNKDGKHRIPTQHIHSIQIYRGTQITSDAIFLALQNEIEVLFVDRAGKPRGRVWSPEYGSISTIRKGQLVFTSSNDAVAWIKNTITSKIENQQAMLLSLNNDENEVFINNTIKRMDKFITKIQSLEGEIPSDVVPNLRGLEGTVSRLYFSVLNRFVPDKYRFNERSQHPAYDVTNALLNYGYGILYGKVEGALIIAGIDPYIGIMHSDNYNRPALSYDVIEKYRVWIDYIIYSLLKQDVITSEMYSVQDDHSVWLESLGKRVVIQSVNDYFEEVICVKGINRSRNTQISLYCQDLAQTMKKFNQ